MESSQGLVSPPPVSPRVDVGFGSIVTGVFTPVLAKHSKSFSLIDCISVGVDRMQRNFEPMRKQVEAWQRTELTDVAAKVVIYEAFVEGRLEAPRYLARTVHDLYFEPKYEEFKPRTIWSLSNAFTSAFKELDPIPQFKATAKLGESLEAVFTVVLDSGTVPAATAKPSHAGSRRSITILPEARLWTASRLFLGWRPLERSFHHTSTAAVLENLPRIVPVETP